MNYQVTETGKIKLNVGDVIRDDNFRASCTIDKIENNIIHVSNVSYSHAYELTRFSLSLFHFMKKTLGISEINLKTNLGSFSVDKNDSERALYRRLVHAVD